MRSGTCSSGRAETTADTGTAEVERARGQLARTLADLRDLAGGLHPRALTEDGLAAALASLARRSPVPVELAVPAERLPAEVEVAAYFVCSEALANVAKYASASRAVVRVTADDRAALVEVVDDGVGGADPAQGSGLRGLADRVEALGGALRLESPPGVGTRLAAELPLHGEAPSGDGRTGGPIRRHGAPDQTKRSPRSTDGAGVRCSVPSRSRKKVKVSTEFSLGQLNAIRLPMTS